MSILLGVRAHIALDLAGNRRHLLLSSPFACPKLQNTCTKRLKSGLASRKPTKAGMRVASFNVLADGLAQSGDFVKVPPEVLVWPYRLPLIIRELHNTQADIICLQELNHFGDVASALEPQGYKGHFLPKRSSRGNDYQYPPDGVAIFYNTRRFSALSSPSAHYFVSPQGAPQSQCCLMWLLHDLVHLRDLLVVTTHLKAKSGHENEEQRVSQVQQILRHITNVVDNRGQGSKGTLLRTHKGGAGGLDRDCKDSEGTVDVGVSGSVAGSAAAPGSEPGAATAPTVKETQQDPWGDVGCAAGWQYGDLSGGLGILVCGDLNATMEAPCIGSLYGSPLRLNNLWDYQVEAAVGGSGAERQAMTGTGPRNKPEGGKNAGLAVEPSPEVSLTSGQTAEPQMNTCMLHNKLQTNAVLELDDKNCEEGARQLHRPGWVSGGQDAGLCSAQKQVGTSADSSALRDSQSLRHGYQGPGQCLTMMEATGDRHTATSGLVCLLGTRSSPSELLVASCAREHHHWRRFHCQEQAGTGRVLEVSVGGLSTLPTSCTTTRPGGGPSLEICTNTSLEALTGPSGVPPASEKGCPGDAGLRNPPCSSGSHSRPEIELQAVTSMDDLPPGPGMRPRLSQPMPVPLDWYPEEFTTWKFRSSGESKRVIDYVWFNEELRLLSRWRMLREDDIGPQGLPCSEYPSDHVAVVCDLQWISS